MIYTITTNPSLDYTVEADLAPGRVNRTRSETIYPGGKGINVAVMLHRLGMETTALGFAAGRIGQAIRDLLDDQQVPHELIQLAGGQSRINVKFRSTAGMPETAVNGLGPKLTREGMDRMLARLRTLSPEDCVVISGWAQSIPFYLDLLELANSAGATTVLDCSGEALWQCLKRRPILIKPNLTELGSLFGVEDLELSEAIELAMRLQDEGARNVLVSMGSSGAFLLTEDRRLFTADACSGTVISTVGSGDALVAGFLTGWKKTGDYVKSLRLGAAAGCGCAFCDWLCSGDDVLALVERIHVEEVTL